MVIYGDYMVISTHNIGQYSHTAFKKLSRSIITDINRMGRELNCAILK